jgi:hypothetical protein
MANVLKIDGRIEIVAALAEGASIHSVEQITGIHRGTIMRIRVRVGRGCAALMDREISRAIRRWIQPTRSYTMRETQISHSVM